MIRTAVVFSVLSASLFAASPELWYRSPAPDWRHALPIGNGKLAAMVFGGVAEERLQLNEESLYAGKRMNRANPNAKANLSAIRQLLLEGKAKEAESLAEKNFLAVPLRQPPYETLGDLTILFDIHSEPAQYRRSLDLYDGIAKVDFTMNGIHFSREAFASYPDGVIAVHLTSDRAGALNFQATLSRKADATVSSRDSRTLLLSGIALPPGDKNHQYADEAKTGASFAAELSVVTDGAESITGGKLTVKGASEATLLIAAATDVNGSNPVEQAQSNVDRAASKSFAELRARHVKDFGAIARRVSLIIGTPDYSLPTDELLTRTDDSLTSLYFAYGRYLLQSSSRENSLAANLQGKWNDKLDPAWGSKYTININTEMNYWPAEVCNLGETVEGLYNLLKSMQSSGRRDAQEMYGTGGFVAHHNTDVWGDTEPIDGVPYGVWPMGGAWLTLSLWEHYDYSRDLGFLRDKAYPMMREAALFLADNLFDDGAGHLVSGPSLSPENLYRLPDNRTASLDVSPTMDIEITTELFRHVVAASRVLNTDEAFRGRLTEILPKLVPLQVGKFGQLQEWRKDYPEVELGHRHLSHLFGVYPGSSITPQTPELYKAARVSLERRLANGGGGTGWSRAWVTALWAMFHEGDKAGDSLQVLYKQSTWPNLFDTHPPNIFQIDGNLGATAAITQMLVQSRDSDSEKVLLELLPALPASWQQGHVAGLPIRGGATVDVSWKNHALAAATLYAARDISLAVQTGDRGTAQTIELKGGESADCRTSAAGEVKCRTRPNRK